MKLLTALALASLALAATSCSAGDPPTTPAEEDRGPAASPDAGEPPAEPAAAAAWSEGDTIPSGAPNVPPIRVLAVHKNGSGEVCGTGRTATLAYKAMKADGSVLDPGRKPFSFRVGGGEAIKGWDVIVARMRVGDSFTVLVPQQLAYGPGRGDLKFDMELLSVE